MEFVRGDSGRAVDSPNRHVRRSRSARLPGWTLDPLRTLLARDARGARDALGPLSAAQLRARRPLEVAHEQRARLDLRRGDGVLLQLRRADGVLRQLERR